MELAHCGCVIISIEESIIVASLETMNKYICSNYLGLLEELFSSYSLRAFYLAIICKTTSVHKFLVNNLCIGVILQMS